MTRISFLTLLWFSFVSAPLWGENWKVYVASYKHDKACAITYTFDDGLIEHYTLVVPELEKRGFRGTFFINGSKVTDGKQIKRQDETSCLVGTTERNGSKRTRNFQPRLGAPQRNQAFAGGNKSRCLEKRQCHLCECRCHTTHLCLSR